MKRPYRYLLALLVLGGIGQAALAQDKKDDTKGFQDSFATLDTSRWWVADGYTNGDHQSCEWRADANTIENNTYVMTLSDRGGKVRPIGCPTINTKARLSYGRYETRMKTASGVGLNTAFFTYIGPPNGVPEWDEIDFEFLGKAPNKVEINYIVAGKTIKGKIHDLGFDSSKEFHDYTLIWSKTNITWLVDGKEIYKTPDGAPIPRNPSHMFFSLWSGSPEWMGPFKYEKPVTAEVKWARFTPE